MNDIMKRMQDRARDRARNLTDPFSEKGREDAFKGQTLSQKADNTPQMTVAQAEALRMDTFRQQQAAIIQEAHNVQSEIADINAKRTEQIAKTNFNLTDTQQRNLSLINEEIQDIQALLKNSANLTPEELTETLSMLDSRINELAALQTADAQNKLKALDKNPESYKEAPYINNAKQDLNQNKTLSAGKKNPKDAAAETIEETEAPKIVPNIFTRANIIPLEANLKKKVFGQDEVIEKIVAVSKNAFTKLRVNKKKPAGSYFFAGPSGVGKTELARTMAESLGVPILIINMGEYSKEHETAKLLGAPPGYVGSEEPGIIPRFIEKHPNCVILFDEIEKADPTADNILLSILDQGVCQDNRGNDVNFKETVIICTSNLGAKVEYYTHLTQEEKNNYRMEAIKGRIRTEIIGRYDGLFHFHPLNDEVYMMIINKFVKGIVETVKEEHGLTLTFSPATIDMIAKKSYDPSLGGRPAGKFIEQITVAPLAEFLLLEDYEEKAAADPELTLDINSEGNLYLRGDRTGKALCVTHNTAEILALLEKTRLTERKELDDSQDDIAIIPPENPKPTQKVEVPGLQTQPQAKLQPKEKKSKPTAEEVSAVVAPVPSRKPRPK